MDEAPPLPFLAQEIQPQEFISPRSPKPHRLPLFPVALVSWPPVLVPSLARQGQQTSGRAGWACLSEGIRLWGSLQGPVASPTHPSWGRQIVVSSCLCLSFSVCKMGVRNGCDTAYKKPLYLSYLLTQGLCSLMYPQVPKQDS